MDNLLQRAELQPAAPQSSGVDWWAETTHSEASAPEAMPQTSPEPAGFATALRSGTIEDTAAKIRLFSQKRYPNQPDEERIARYGIHDGRITYRDDDGKVYFELGTPGRVAAGTAEYAPSIAGGLAFGAMGPPGWIGAAGMAAVGSAGGLAARKIAGEIQGDDQTVAGNVADLGIEAALGAGGVKVGEAIGKRIVDRRAVRDLPKLSDASAQHLDSIARGQGITLTPAELTNLGSLIQQQSMLGQGADEAADTLRGFYGDRAGKIVNVIDDFIGATPGPHATGKLAADSGEEIIDTATRARTEAVRPEYLRLMRSGVALPRAQAAKLRTMMDIDDPYIAQLIKRAKTDPLWVAADGVNITKLPDTSLAVIDRAKKLLDHEINVATSRGGREAEVAMLMQRKDKLVGLADDAFPEYAAVRAKYEGMSPEIDVLRQSAIGVVSKYKGTQLEKAASTLVNTRADPA